MLSMVIDIARIESPQAISIRDEDFKQGAQNIYGYEKIFQSVTPCARLAGLAWLRNGNGGAEEAPRSNDGPSHLYFLGGEGGREERPLPRAVRRRHCHRISTSKWLGEPVCVRVLAV